MQSLQTPDRWRTLAFTSLGHLVNDGWVTFIPLMADLIINAKGTSPVTVTLMSVSFYSSAALLNFAIGHAADTSGAQGKMMATGIAIISLAFLGFDVVLRLPEGISSSSALSSSGSSTMTTLYVALVVLAILAGFGSAFYHPIAGSIIQTSFGFTSRGKALGVNGSFGQVGAAMFPPVFFGIALAITEPNALAVLGVLGLVASVAIWMGLGGYRTGRRSSGGGAEVGRKSAREALTRGIVILTGITVVRAIANTGISVWLPTYITFVRGEGVGSLLGLTIALTFAGAIPGQLVFGALVERLDKRYVLGISSGGAGLAVIGYIFTSGYESLALITLFGFFTYSTFPTLLSLASDYVPSESWTAANGFVWGFGMMGGNVIGPAVTQLIIGEDYSRLSLAFVCLAILGLVGAAVTPLLKKGEYAMKREAPGPDPK